MWKVKRESNMCCAQLSACYHDDVYYRVDSLASWSVMMARYELRLHSPKA